MSPPWKGVTPGCVMAASGAHSHQLCLLELDRSLGRLVITTSHPAPESQPNHFQMAAGPLQSSGSGRASVPVGSCLSSERPCAKGGLALEPNYVSWVCPLNPQGPGSVLGEG